jgi:hypothetical protein
VLIWRTSNGAAVEAGDANGPAPRILVPATFADAGNGMSPPVANGDRLLVFRRTIASPGEVALKVRAIRTGREWTSAFWIPGASAVRIETAALTTDGHALLAGLSTSAPEGAGRLNDAIGRDLQSFAAEVEPSGRVLKTIDFGTYAVQRLCASDDGTFWTIGRDWKQEREADIPETYHVVRQYSARGEMLSQFLPRHWLGPSPALDDPGAPQVRPSTAFLACGQRSIVAYLAKTAQGFLVAEIDRSSGETRSRHVIRVPGLVMTSLAVLEDKSIHATFAAPVRARHGARATSPRQDSTDAAAGSRSAPGLYTLDANSRPAVWHPDAASRFFSKAGSLIGTDGESLLVWRRAGALTNSSLVWTTPGRSTP